MPSPAGAARKVVYFWGAKPSSGAFACLSNFYPCRFVDAEGHAFHSSEQAMMLGKALVFGDAEAAEAIMRTRHAKEAKQLGRTVRGFDERMWAERARQIVEQACFNKFAQNEELRVALLRTGDALLAEASPYDAIWGIGLSASQAEGMAPHEWPGTNWLGLVLGAVRERLRAHSSERAPVSLLGAPPAPPPPRAASPADPAEATGAAEAAGAAEDAAAPRDAHTHLLVLDFEATCEADAKRFPHEIIELPAVLLHARTREQVGEFRTFVRPTERPALSAFCTELTSITQAQLEGAPTLGEALRDLERWLDEAGLGQPARVLPVTCGDWDLGKQLPAECARKGLRVPAVLTRWCNVKRAYAAAMRTRKFTGMAGMLDGLGLPLIGRHHLGIDDARNIAAIARTLGARGAALEQTGGSSVEDVTSPAAPSACGGVEPRRGSSDAPETAAAPASS